MIADLSLGVRRAFDAGKAHVLMVSNRLTGVSLDSCSLQPLARSRVLTWKLKHVSLASLDGIGHLGIRQAREEGISGASGVSGIAQSATTASRRRCACVGDPF